MRLTTSTMGTLTDLTTDLVVANNNNNRRDPACVGRLVPPSWPRSPLGLVAYIAYIFQWGCDGNSLQYCRWEQLLVFLTISWKMTGAQFAFYLLPVSGPVSLLDVDVGSVLGRR